MAFSKLTSDELRLHKGISFTGITTVFFCHDGNGKLLLAKRSPKARDEHGRWDAGAGGLKHGQTLEDNLKREINEEYGVAPTSVKFIGYMDIFRQSPEGRPTHWLAMYFSAIVDPNQVRINDAEAIEEIGWFDLDNLPSPMHSQFNNFIRKHGRTLRKHMDIKEGAYAR